VSDQFKLFMGGAEEPGWRRLLIDNGARHITLSFRHLHRRLPKTKPFILADRVPDGVEIFLDSAAHNAKRNEAREHSLTLLDDYVSFIKTNLDRLTLFSEFDALDDMEWVQGQRERIWDGFPRDQFMAVWHAAHGVDELRRLADHYSHVGIPRADITPGVVVLLRSLADTAAFHAIGEADPDVLRHAFSSASTHSWLSATKFGETIVWQNNRLKRYPAKMKEQARRRHRMLFQGAGFDAAAIEHDDHDEVARFTIWSFLRLEEYLGSHRGRSTGDAPRMTPANVENGSVAVDGLPAPMRNSRVTLPVLSGAPGKAPALLRAPVRRCDACHVAATCPGFLGGAECAYDIPVEIKTKEQLLGLLQGVIEMQTQRVVFARFSEELEGGYPDANLSNEMDRLMRVIGQAKNIQDDRDFLEITMKSHAQAGVLSRIFGVKEAEPTHQLRRQLGPAETDHVVATIIEAETVEESTNTNGHAGGRNGT